MHYVLLVVLRTIQAVIELVVVRHPQAVMLLLLLFPCPCSSSALEQHCLMVMVMVMVMVVVTMIVKTNVTKVV